MTWRSSAACAHEDPELFFPAGATGAFLEQVEVAKAICGRCRVQMRCLEFALSEREPDGIWGGSTPDERQRLLRDPSSAELRRLFSNPA